MIGNRPLAEDLDRLGYSLGRTSQRNRLILARYLAGHRQKDIAAEFGIGAARVHQIVWPLRLRNLTFRRVR